MTLPISMRDNPLRPCEDMTIRSTPSFSAQSTMAPKGWPASTILRIFRSNAGIGDFISDKLIKPFSVSLHLLLVDGVGFIQ